MNTAYYFDFIASGKTFEFNKAPLQIDQTYYKLNGSANTGLIASWLEYNSILGMFLNIAIFLTVLGVCDVCARIFDRRIIISTFTVMGYYLCNSRPSVILLSYGLIFGFLFVFIFKNKKLIIRLK